MSNSTVTGKPAPIAGMPITAEEAQLYMEQQQTLKNHLKTILVSVRPSNDVEIDTSKYYNSEVNAFVFSYETLARFFPKDSSEPRASHLLVIMGAKYEGQDKGEPTIVLAGVTEENGNFFSLDIEKPGTEQPPRKTIADFPPKGSAGRIKFTII